MYLKQIRLTAKPFGMLTQQARPSVGQPEVVPWFLYSRKSYVSGTTVRLTYFDTIGDLALTNMELQSQLPTPQFFEVFSFHFTVLQPSRSTLAPAGGNALTGSLDNVEQLHRSGRGRWAFKMSGKEYGPFPLHTVGPAGNMTGLLTGLDNVAAGGTPDAGQVAGWAAQFGCSDPIITIPPTTHFEVISEWPAALTLDGGNTYVEFGLWGALHRKVV